MDKRKYAKENASKIVQITIEDAKKLPNMLGKIVPVQLAEYGWYATSHGDQITYYEKI